MPDPTPDPRATLELVTRLEEKASLCDLFVSTQDLNGWCEVRQRHLRDFAQTFRDIIAALRRLVEVEAENARLKKACQIVVEQHDELQRDDPLVFAGVEACRTALAHREGQ